MLGLLVCAPWLVAAQSQPQPTNYSLQVQPGFNSIANHLNRSNNALKVVIPDPPDNSQLYKWNAGSQSYRDVAEFIGGDWFSSDPNALYLHPGEGAFLYVNQNANLNFSGDIAQFTLPRPLLLGYNFVSAHLPRAMHFAELFGFLPQTGDHVYLFDNPFIASPDSLDQNASSIHKFTAQGWDSAPPIFKRGRSAFVFLSDAPRILVQPPTRQIVSAGDRVHFDVSVGGAGPFSYQWLFNEDDLPGENKPSLTLSNVQFWQSGLYSVVVSNAAGVVTSRPTSLRVDSPPVILEPPQSVRAIPSQWVAFHVKAVGTPNLRYQWYRNNLALQNETKPTLEFSAQQPGQFHVVVMNGRGSVPSQPVALEVNLPPRITKQPISQTVNAHDTVVFTVTAEGTQPLTYQWRRNGRNIPGATEAILVIRDVASKHAGHYHVTVANVAGVADSELALLTVLDAEPIFLSDFFEGSPLRMETTFIGRGTNLDAKQNEDSEPLHCERFGGSSVWMSWMTREPGIVTFDTSGSSFDTVIAAYVGNVLPELLQVACDDDEGEFFGSRMRFVARPNTIYHIAIDGLDGAKGQIILDWDLKLTPETLPIIRQQPRDQTARFGDSVTFFVDVEVVPGTPAPRFQWFHNGLPIAGQIQRFLTLQSVDKIHLGYYHVEITQGDQTVRSRRASLQISLSGAENNLLQAFAVDKFADAVARTVPPAPLPSDGDVTQMSFVPVLGYTGTQIFSTEGFEGEPGELSHCSIPGGSSAWFTYTAPTNGQFYLNTAGSTFNTVLGVYTGPGPTIATLRRLICDNDSGPGTTSSLNFAATKNTVYYIAVDGFNGVTGTATLNYRLLVPMTLTRIVKPNETQCRLRVTATPSYPFTIERCAGFSIWVPVLTTNSALGFYDYRDTNATVQKRFYRAFQTP